MRFRLVTYNVHKGIGGVDRRYRPQRVVDVLAHCRPDIVFLQEVDAGVPRSNHDRQVDLFADALELPHRAYFPNVTLRQGQYGNAIISRFHLSEVGNIDLSVRLKKRRGAVVAQCHPRFDHHTRSLLLFNLHLGLAGFERSIQLRRLLESEHLARRHRNTPILVGGDFNDPWGNLGKRILVPAGFHLASGRIRTFPAFRPMRRLDRIYSRGDVAVLHAFASRTKVARQASDHLPIVADFQFQP